MSDADSSAYVGAYLIEGDAFSVERLVRELAHSGVTAPGSPDLLSRAYRKFGVDEAEELRMRARTKPVRDAHRVFVLFAPAMTAESQNALLKTIEEPSANALFFIITPSPDTLLPTLRSRMQRMALEGIPGETSGTLDVQAFLEAPIPARLEMLKPLYEHGEEEGRDIGSVIAFLQACERRFAALPPGNARTEGLKALYRARRYAGDKGSLLKTLLEQFALLAPRT